MSALIDPTVDSAWATVEATHLRVSEVFGPTFQGEGPSLGRRCTFLRLGGCNLHCSWCDTPYTWDWTGRNGKTYDPRVELRQVSTERLWKAIVAQQTGMLVITGGEPLLQQRTIVPLLKIANATGWWIEIETAGTLTPSAAVVELVDRFNVSPKLGNSGNQRELRERPAAITRLQHTGKAVWKFVVEDIGDLEAVGELERRFALAPVWIMPEGVTSDAINGRATALAESVLARGWNMTTRLQVQLWGDRRGV